MNQKSDLLNITDPKKQHNIIQAVVKCINVDYLVQDNEGTNIIEIVFKNPSNNLTMTDKGLNLNTGKNIVADMLEEIELSSTEGIIPTFDFRNTPAFLRG